MEVNATKVVKVNAKMLSIHIQCRDCFQCSITDQDGAVLRDYDGYVPDFMPGQHYGDSVILDIDLDTGRITNWKTPSVEQIEEFIKGDE